jgi:hypothetical protein
MSLESREARAATVREPRPGDPSATPTTWAPSILASQPNGRSVGSLVDLAAWKRLRRSPAGGCWFGGHSMWSWDEAARSERRWSA